MLKKKHHSWKVKRPPFIHPARKFLLFCIRNSEKKGDTFRLFPRKHQENLQSHGRQFLGWGLNLKDCARWHSCGGVRLACIAFTPRKICLTCILKQSFTRLMLMVCDKMGCLCTFCMIRPKLILRILSWRSTSSFSFHCHPCEETGAAIWHGLHLQHQCARRGSSASLTWPARAAKFRRPEIFAWQDPCG